MIVYRVTVTLQASAESEWTDWMRQVHVPDVLKTGCFLDAHMYKVLDCDEPTYVLQYDCRSIEDYQRYRALLRISGQNTGQNVHPPT